MSDIRSVMMEMPLEMPTTTQPTEENVPHKRVYCPVSQNIRNELKQKWIEHGESWSAEKYSQETGIKWEEWENSCQSSTKERVSQLLPLMNVQVVSLSTSIVDYISANSFSMVYTSKNIEIVPNEEYANIIED